MRRVCHHSPTRLRLLSAVLICMVLSSSCLLLSGVRAQAEALSLPQSGVKTPYSPLAIPTRLERLDRSLEQLLNQNYHIIAAHPANGEEILLLTQPGGQRGKRQGNERQKPADNTVICALTMPDPATDQNVPTSRCWALNHPS